MAAGTGCGCGWVTSACLEIAPVYRAGKRAGFGLPFGIESICIHALHVLQLLVHAFGTYIGILSEFARWYIGRQEQDKGWERERGGENWFVTVRMCMHRLHRVGNQHVIIYENCSCVLWTWVRCLSSGLTLTAGSAHVPLSAALSVCSCPVQSACSVATGRHSLENGQLP